ncbi:MAG: hypothetical protein EPN53_00950 [Acidobacteria bacterium]|nr:MAG: hypothetical protein EPN53_00950 [Acidobacteriota bacterium]
MERLLNDLPMLLGVLLAVLLWFAVVFAILRMDTTTRAMLAELQKINAALFLAHDLVEGPPVKGKPRIVRAAEHRPGT